MPGGGFRRAAQHNGCPRTGKIKYTREDYAERALAKAQAAGKGVKRVYRCRFCHGFHLTSQEIQS